jgi:hypothetical protein
MLPMDCRPVGNGLAPYVVGDNLGNDLRHARTARVDLNRANAGTERPQLKTDRHVLAPRSLGTNP